MEKQPAIPTALGPGNPDDGDAGRQQPGMAIAALVHFVAALDTFGPGMPQSRARPVVWRSFVKGCCFHRPQGDSGRRCWAGGGALGASGNHVALPCGGGPGEALSRRRWAFHSPLPSGVRVFPWAWFGPPNYLQSMGSNYSSRPIQRSRFSRVWGVNSDASPGPNRVSISCKDAI